MGLNEVYVSVRSNLLMMQPPPTLDSAYNILLQDKRQRQINSNSQFGSDSAAFTAKINLNHQSNPNTNYKPPGSNTHRQYVQRVNFDQAKGNLFCRYCKKSGHLIDKCFKFHDFPPNFKFTKTKKIAGNATVGTDFSPDDCTNFPSLSAVGTTNNDAQGSLVSGLTKQQYSQLMALLQHSHAYDSAPQSDFMTSANFADVLYIPYFKHNLISAQKLILLLRCIAQFSSDSCLLQGPSLKMPLELGKQEDGLYKFAFTTAFSSLAQNDFTMPTICSFPSLPSSIVDPSFGSSLCNSSSSQNALSQYVPPCNEAALNKMDIIWHQRLAHVPFVRMKGIPIIFSSLSSKQHFPYEICPMARQTRLPFPDSSIHSTHPFQLIHVDTWGTYHTPTHSGSRYFLTIVDDFYRSSWTHLSSSKNNAFSLIKALVAIVKTQFHITIQTIRSDNALELGGSHSAISYFSDNSIIHQTTCPHTQQQNGVVERKHRTLLEACRALPFQSKAPIRFWEDSPLLVIPSSVPTAVAPDAGPLRRSDKTHHLPPYLNDYVCYLPPSFSCITTLSPPATFEPITYSQAAPIPAWKDAPRKEFEALEANIVALPSGKKLIGSYSLVIPSSVPTAADPDVGPLRRSNRTHHLPPHLNDYVCHLPPSFSCITTLSPPATFEPSTYSQAAPIPTWQDAMRKEFEALEANIVALSSGKKLIRCKWVYKIKYKADDTIERYKSRLVIKGDTQVERVDFNETFFPIVKMSTVKCLVVVAVKNDLDEEVYIKLPPGLSVTTAPYSSSSTLVYHLQKSLYGLRQASRQWYGELSQALYSRGYTHSLNDYSLFIKGSPGHMVIIAVYVDDIILTGDYLAEINALKSFLDA
uniref:Integrase catalytic domain-containing protein n=1 Tax=Nicotiana tabacum TaxID=4097 RepID=A0A1S3XZU3_TOBAC|nr:PREDICTED: uncharacterized protein LOC107770645 [Nicotiana tabacum]